MHKGSLNSVKQNQSTNSLLSDNHPSRKYRTKWLEILLMVFMWTHKDCNRIISIIGTVFMLTLTFFYAYYTYFDNVEEKIKLAMFNFLDFGAFSAIRITSIYYFFKIFEKYPWNKLTLGFHHDELERYYIQKVRSTNIRLVLLIFFYICLMSLHFVSYGLYFHDRRWIDTLVDFFASVYGVYIPIILTQFVFTFITLKYELYLFTIKKQIALECDDGFVFINTIFSSYRAMYNSFKSEYGKTWQFFLLFELFAICYAVWMIIASLIHSDIFGEQELSDLIWAISGSFYVLPFIEFVYSASKMNNEYVQVKKCFWNLRIKIMKQPKKSIISTDETIESQQIKRYSILRNQHNIMKQNVDHEHNYTAADFKIHTNFQSCFEYIKDHQLNINLIGTRITGLNALKGVMAFAVAKMISYSIYYI